MKKESNKQDSKKIAEEKKNSKKDKDNSEEVQEEILEVEQQEILEQEEAQENEESEHETDFEKEIDSEDIEEEIEDDEEIGDEESDDGEIKFNHWLHSSAQIQSGIGKSSLSKLERANIKSSGSLESSVAFAPRIKDSREGKKYSNSKYEFSKYSSDAVKKYSEQTPGKDSNEEKNQ
ncbi:MAG TPA: hypothetical protein PLK34_01180 [Candidatus Pacearchaeota archaeon]|nr:hypothetical protein [Candidatus Pacearchaeota archaeon]